MPADADRPAPSRGTAALPRRRWRIARGVLRYLVSLLAFALTAAGVMAFAAIISRYQLAAPGQTRFAVQGVDVSHHQGDIDWVALAASDVQFAFIKATEGTDHRDTLFERNWSASAAAGVQRGAYHYFTFCSSGAAQAAHLTRVVPPGQAMLPTAVDVEYSGNCANPPPAAHIREQLLIMLRDLTLAYGRKPILYTTNEARVRLLRGEFSEYPLWIRNVYAPPWSLGVTQWTFWQHSDDGQRRGVRTQVDLNVFHGDLAMFRACVQRGACAPELPRTPG